MIEKGALADMILVDGNPLDDLTLLERPAERFSLIMKDGLLVKNTLSE